MFPNYSGWFGLWSLVHLLDMCGDSIVHLEGTLFVLLCRPFYMIIWVRETCDDTMVHMERKLFFFM